MVTVTVLKDDIVMQVVQCRMPFGKQVSMINVGEKFKRMWD